MSNKWSMFLKDKKSEKPKWVEITYLAFWDDMIAMPLAYRGLKSGQFEFKIIKNDRKKKKLKGD